jgi:hypothetical protein
MLAHAFGTRVAAAASLRRAFATQTQQKIHYTHTDEAPMLATYALLPIIKRFTVPVRARGCLCCLALRAFCTSCVALFPGLPMSLPLFGSRAARLAVCLLLFRLRRLLFLWPSIAFMHIPLPPLTFFLFSFILVSPVSLIHTLVPSVSSWYPLPPHPPCCPIFSTTQAGINVEKIDISVAARVLAQFSERLKPEQRVGDKLGELGEIVKTPNANVYAFLKNNARMLLFFRFVLCPIHA